MFNQLISQDLKTASLGDIQLEQKRKSCMPFWLDLYQYFKSFCCFETQDWFPDNDLCTNIPRILPLFHNHKTVQVWILEVNMTI